MNLKAIAKHLADNGYGTLAKDIFITEFPSGVKSGTLLKDNIHGDPINYDYPGWVESEYRICVRVPDGQYESGLEKTNKIIKFLTIMRPTEMDGGKVSMVQSLPIIYPRPYRRTDGGRYWEFETDVACIYIQS